MTTTDILAARIKQLESELTEAKGRIAALEKATQRLVDEHATTLGLIEKLTGIVDKGVDSVTATLVRVAEMAKRTSPVGRTESPRVTPAAVEWLKRPMLD